MIRRCTAGRIPRNASTTSPRLSESPRNEGGRAVVAGAGVSGLSAAIALAKIGWRVSVFERAPLLDEAGAGIQIPPNAAAILREWGVLERLRSKALAPEALRLRSGRSGRDIVRMPLGPVAELRWGAPSLVAHRADLVQALLEQAAADGLVAIETGIEVTGFARSESGIEVALRRGEAVERVDGDLLIGADGLRSSVRKRLGLGAADEPIWSGKTAWRALLDGRRAPRHAMRLETCLWLGRHGHLVHYPLRRGELVNLVVVVEDGWRGGDESDDLWAAPGNFAAIRRIFARWHPDARDLLEAPDSWRRWPLFDRRASSRWTDPRVALVGDAAHPMMPFLAQGAAQAVEDAKALASALSISEGVDQALPRYEAARTSRAAAVQMASRRHGAIYHLGGPAAWARDAVLDRMGFARMMQQLDWLYRPA